jgi:hypothetical protein
MGFMNFGKKDKNDNMDSLDIPPPPPIEGVAQTNLNVLPQVPMQQEMPKFGQQPSMPKNNIFPPPKMSGEMSKLEDSFSMNSSSSLPDDIPMFGNTEQKGEKLKSFDEIFKPMPSKREDLQSQEKRAPIISSSDKQVFIEVGKYKKTLGELHLIQKTLKQTDVEISALIQDINDEEKTFSKLRTALSDVEKKLAYLEGGLLG